MSDAGGEGQARQHLLAVVERYREQQCGELLDAANAQARQLLSQAWREARARLRRGIADVRLHYRHRIGEAEARQQTRMRQQRQRDNSALLASLWEPLQAAVVARWQRPDTRRAWIDALLQQAADSLLDSAWLIEHPADWPQGEQRAVRDRLGTLSVSFQPQAGITAGLRICAGGACVDGSLEGLLRDRVHIESLLLARLAEQCRAQRGDCSAP